METRTFRVADTEIAIRLMGSDYFMGDAEPPGLTVDLDCRRFAKTWPNPVYVAYYGKLTRAYGAAAVLAWRGSSVVGFLPFVPQDTGMPRLPSCIHYVVSEEGDEDGPPRSAIENGVPAPFEKLSAKTLRVHCLSVQPELRRNGVGTAMVRYLIDWARARGWKRIEGTALVDGDWGWLPNVEFWEKAGFTRDALEESDHGLGQNVGFHVDLGR